MVSFRHWFFHFDCYSKCCFSIFSSCWYSLYLEFRFVNISFFEQITFLFLAPSRICKIKELLQYLLFVLSAIVTAVFSNGFGLSSQHSHTKTLGRWWSKTGVFPFSIRELALIHEKSANGNCNSLLKNLWFKNQLVEAKCENRRITVLNRVLKYLISFYAFIFLFLSSKKKF